MCVDVRDTGQGIAPDFLPRIFDMFSQGQTGAARAHWGPGHRALAGEATGRNAWRANPCGYPGVGRGATFCVRLPEMATAFPPEHHTVEVDASVLKGLRVLLVDDSEDTLDAFRILLEMEGAKVRAERSGKAALAAAAEAPVRSDPVGHWHAGNERL